MEWCYNDGLRMETNSGMLKRPLYRSLFAELRQAIALKPSLLIARLTLALSRRD